MVEQHSGFGTTGMIDLDSAWVELIPRGKTPSSATDAGTRGEVCWDASYIYVCVAANTWKRAAISTWA